MKHFFELFLGWVYSAIPNYSLLYCACSLIEFISFNLFHLLGFSLDRVRAQPKLLSIQLQFERYLLDSSNYFIRPKLYKTSHNF